MEPVFYNDEEYREILQYLEQLTREVEQIPYPQAKELATSVLQYLDLMHREALARMIKTVESHYPELHRQISADYTTRTLFGLYDLLEGAGGSTKSDDVKTLGFVPISEVKILTPRTRTDWYEAGRLEELEEGRLLSKLIAEKNIVVVKVGGQIHAFHNACIGSILPLDQGRVEDHYLICPWHGCRYELGSGNLLDRPGEKLETYKITIENDGTYKIGITAQIQ